MNLTHESLRRCYTHVQAPSCSKAHTLIYSRTYSERQKTTRPSKSPSFPPSPSLLLFLRPSPPLSLYLFFLLPFSFQFMYHLFHFSILSLFFHFSLPLLSQLLSFPPSSPFPCSPVLVFGPSVNIHSTEILWSSFQDISRVGVDSTLAVFQPDSVL